MMLFKCIDDLKKPGRLPALQQSARCPVVKQPNLAAPYSELVGG